MAYGVVLGQSSSEASNVSYNNSATSEIITSTDVQGAIDQLFTSVSEGKQLIASAVTDKGIQTPADATFNTIADNIGKIKQSSEFDIGNYDFITMGIVSTAGLNLRNAYGYEQYGKWLCITSAGLYNPPVPYSMIVFEATGPNTEDFNILYEKSEKGGSSYGDTIVYWNYGTNGDATLNALKGKGPNQGGNYIIFFAMKIE